MQLELQIQAKEEHYGPVGFIQRIYANHSRTSPVCCGRIVPKLLSDFTLMKSWIDRCHVGHRPHWPMQGCRKTKQLLEGFLLDRHT